MANLKKEIKALIKRLNAAEDALASNDAKAKKQRKKLKKKLAASKKEAEGLEAKLKSLETEVKSLKEAAKPAPKKRGRKPGPKAAPKKPAARRGRPRKTTVAAEVKATAAPKAEAKPAAQLGWSSKESGY
jgi:DNA repair exonuclease SbcCD ATPase subunit